MTSQEHFDAKARDWDAHPGKRQIAQVFAAELQKNLSLHRSMEILEFGCGTGLVSLALCGQVASITLLDTSPGMIEVLREKIHRQGLSNMHPHLGDLSLFKGRRDCFDLIYSNMALHHVRDSEQTLLEMARLLKTGGALCLGDLESEDGSFHPGDMTVHHGFDCRQLCETLKRLGLQIEHCHRSHSMEKTNAEGRLRSYPLFFLQARKPGN